ncbi:MAG: type II secretion system F family protein [Sedimenticola sp.]
MEAADTRTVVRTLQREGRTVLQIREAQTGGNAPPSKERLPSPDPKHLSHKDIELITLELATLLRAGLPLDQALENLSQLAEKPAVAAITQELHQSIRHGTRLSDAMAQTSERFDRFYLNMVRAGESTGNLGLALERLASFKARARATRESLISALIYPAILLLLALVAVAVMLAFVVPQFTEMFAEAGQQLPLLTRIVAGAGELVTQGWWLMLILGAGATYWARRDWQSPAGRERWDRTLLRTPIAGSLIARLETARFARTLSTLLANGVNLLTAMGIAKEVVGNRLLARALDHTATRVREGEGLAKPLADTGHFPPLAVQLIRVGEESGQLEHMLGQVADIYDREVESGLKRMLTVLEPVIIVTIALFISIIILSVVLMILESNNLAF